MKILLAVDGSADTKKMLAYLTTHEELLGSNSQLVVLNVQPPIPPRAANFVGKETVDQFHLAEAEKVLAPVAKFLERHNLSYATQHRVGHAADEILRTSKKFKVDLIVMGSHGRRSIGSLLLGTVVQTVLSASEVPVMVVR